MDWNTLTAGFTIWDVAALALLLLSWAGATRLIEHPPKNRPSTSVLMADYRRAWMTVFVTRQPRIFDSQIVASLRQGTAFFASASMIAIGGGFALMGNADQLRGVAQDFGTNVDPVVVFEIKLMLMLMFVANAFLKFVWSHRLFGYTSVLMAAVPENSDDPVTLARARKAGEINVTGARSYNRGLRSVYFGIAAAGWLLGPVVLMAATLLTLAVILRREFASHSRAVLLDASDGPL
ncbi:DUF599 domain-containing protein [Antarctobacter heliothermus]|uniref:Uncharacterized membrane protein n=1 Tax=Antarctobacter heliothermus TaxID=74033 RepID=A0A239E5P5_9RHOB|nr:DUF599 domain-containing protein [Antarctobacter heliothermus]SNS39618.1 Uncharacterized membrane protein [Antarctobacter heliothermus]